MTTSEPSQGHNYVFDPEAASEMARLMLLDNVTTKAMGGPLTGLPPLPENARVLDIACGPGGWVLDAAFARPDIEVAGIDISDKMIRYANARAQSQKRANASFGVMDITHSLEFSDESFDLINARLLVAVLFRDSWPHLLSECQRLLKPGGILRLTESDWVAQTTSATFQSLSLLITQALSKIGYGFSPDGYSLGLLPMLPRLMQNAGFQIVTQAAYAIYFSVEAPAWKEMFRNYEIVFEQMTPLLLKQGIVEKEELDTLNKQVLIDMYADDFCALWPFISIIGKKPEK